LRKSLIFFALTGMWSGAAMAQAPWIYQRGVLNAGSGTPQGLPGGGIARGSIFSIYGTTLGPATPAKAQSYPLTTTLGGVTIKVFSGSTSVAVLPIYVSATQINAIMPSTAPLGMVSLQVTYNSRSSNPAPVKVVTSSLGIFTALGTGNGPGILTDASYNVNTLSNTFTAGEAVVLWGTGLGAVADDTVSPPGGNLSTPVEVFVGGVSVPTVYSGRGPGLAGTDQIVFTIPASAPQGCWVPVMVRTEKTYVSNAVTISIGTGGACSDPINPLQKGFVAGGNIGIVAASRYAMHEDIGVLSTVDVVSDQLFQRFSSEKGGAFAFQPFISIPPVGTCTAYNFAGDLFTNYPNPVTFPPGGRFLDTGNSVTLTGTAGTSTFTAATPPSPIWGFLGGSATGYNVSSAPFLNSGTLSLSLPGGADIGPIQANIDAPTPITWTNRDQISPIARSQGFTVNWTGGAWYQYFAIVGVGEDIPTNSSSMFACTIASGASSFTVPPLVLSNIVPSRSDVSQTKAMVYLVAIPQIMAANLSGSGLTAGAAGAFYMTGTTVVFQ
jgi:uncharacterized protein (TIGR03437 family)